MQMKIDRKNPLPLHYQITQHLKQEFANGRWKVGDLFPTDKQLMDEFKVSITTVRQALTQLVNEGYIERQSGKGTHVIRTAIENVDKLRGFFEEMNTQGLKPSAEILDVREIKVNQSLLAKCPQVEIFNANRLFVIEKVQKVELMSVTYNLSYFPVLIGRELSAYNLQSQGIYELLEKNLGIEINHAEQTITAKAANSREAKILGVKTGSPLLVTQRVVFTRENLPIEVHYKYARPDLYKFWVKMDRKRTDNNTVGEVYET